MRLIDTEISKKTKTEITETLRPLISQIVAKNQVPIYVPRYRTSYDLIDLHRIARNSLLNIKLKCYKRNLALLEILSDKQGLPADTTLALKIVRENLNLEHISKYIYIRDWYKIYKNYTKDRLTKQSIKENFL